jgi:hypothetical protein
MFRENVVSSPENIAFYRGPAHTFVNMARITLIAAVPILPAKFRQ